MLLMMSGGCIHVHGWGFFAVVDNNVFVFCVRDDRRDVLCGGDVRYEARPVIVCGMGYTQCINIDLY